MPCVCEFSYISGFFSVRGLTQPYNDMECPQVNYGYTTLGEYNVAGIEVSRSVGDIVIYALNNKQIHIIIIHKQRYNNIQSISRWSIYI